MKIQDNAPSAALQRALRTLRNHPRRRTLAGLGAALLATVVVVSLLLTLPGHGQPPALFTPSPTAGTLTPGGTPDPHASDWMGALQTAADTAYANDLIAR